ncbi:sperm motility kinase 2B-like [Pongo pygmaeus]|uniref:sperm motility kinase 2B-like n=1 Tax=Pongo pygmaeus TaxID=9600 RepID=UPI00300D0E8C
MERDLNPEIIVLDEDGNIKIMDFGFGTTFHEEQKLTALCGTYPYMAPELFLGQGYRCPAMDVWSLGVMLYHMWAHSIQQKSPFLASAPAGLQRKPESFNQAPQHDPVASLSAQSTNSSGGEPETSLAQQASQRDPVAFPSTQSTSSSEAEPKTSLVLRSF